MGMRTISAALGALALMAAGAANAQGYEGRYATGAYVNVGAGNGDCGFTIAGAHAGVTVLGIRAGAGARVGLPGGCRYDAPPAYAGQAYAQPGYGPPQPYYASQAYGGEVSYYQQGYAQPAYGPPAYAQPVYAPPPAPAYGQPCGCQPGPAVYQPY